MKLESLTIYNLPLGTKAKLKKKHKLLERGLSPHGRKLILEDLKK